METKHKYFQLKSSLISALLLIVGFVFLYIYEHVFHGSNNVWATVFHHLSTAFIIAGIWHSIEVFFLRSETFHVLQKIINKEVQPVTDNISERIVELQSQNNLIRGRIHDLSDQIHASRHERRLGFYRSYVESHPELYEELISESEELKIVLNNGYVWIHTHLDDLKERFKTKGKKTVFIFLNSDCDAARVMEEKERLESGAYSAKLKETFLALSEIIDCDADVEFYKTRFPVVQATFLSETKAYLIPRFIIEPSVPPVFVFEKNNHKKCYYRRIRADIDHLLNHPETERCHMGEEEKKC